MKKLLALVLAAMMALGCTAALAADEIGFDEFPIGEEQDVGILHVAAVYFQPVEMEPKAEAGLSVEESNLHIEADISANENDLGYGVGDWVPYLSVDYKIVGSDGKVAAEGTFMAMAASDGPHYGANIALPNADTYTVIFTIHSPEENGYLLHIDAETGVEGRFWTEPLTVTFEGWEYIPQEW